LAKYASTPLEEEKEEYEEEDDFFDARGDEVTL
jgi:hypothetical protein